MFPFSVKTLSALTLAVASLHATSTNAELVVLGGLPGNVGEFVEIGLGVEMVVSANTIIDGGSGYTVGGKIQSPSGDTDLFHRAGTALTFPGSLETSVSWSEPGVDYFFGAATNGLDGAIEGGDNWLKVISDDGWVSWAQFEFDFAGHPDQPTLVSGPYFVTDSSGADFTLAEAVAALVPEPSSLALLGLGGLLIARRRRG